MAGSGRSIDNGPRATLYKRYHMATKKPKRQLPRGFREAGRKNKGILIRVTEAQKRVLAETAKEAGLGLSSWMLSIALHAAQKLKRA
jgi:hypothetical protein